MSDYADMARRVRRLRDDLEDEHERATRVAMAQMRAAVRSKLRANDSVARRVLLSDVREGPTTEPLAGTHTVTERRVHVPGFSKYLEHGTGERGREDPRGDSKHYPAPSPLPPIDPILTWVVAKNVTSDEYDTKVALAQAIAETIGAEGTFPHPFLRPVWHGPEGWHNVVRENRQAMRRALRRF